jgi:stress response protein YsnF
VLVPVGYARLDDDARRVRVDALHTTQVQSLPRFSGDFDEAYEDRVERHFSQSFENDTRYGHPRYDADRLYGTRGSTSPSATTGSRAGRICNVRVRR